MTEEQNPRERPQASVPRDLKQYYLALLTRGPRWNQTDEPEAASLLPRQLAYIREQIEARRYLVAGPVNEDAPYVGMTLIQAADKQEALSIANADPGVKAGHLGVELYPVYLPSLDSLNVRY